jgi:hypothetical protein
VALFLHYNVALLLLAAKNLSAKYDPEFTIIRCKKTLQVSICKFKFTGGARPTLEEKKMLSVDSGGNFRYYSGTGTAGIGTDSRSLCGMESLPRELMSANASNIVTDRFTSLTADKLGRKCVNSSTTNPPTTSNSSSATFDLIRAFDVLPQSGCNNTKPSRSS